MFSHFNMQTKQILAGNIMLICCCIFYLAWWLAAFNPDNAVEGMKSGWLLIPAFILGISGIAFILNSSGINNQIVLFKRSTVLIYGIIAYIVLTAATSVILKRQVTTELILIVGWTVLIFTELNALFSLGHYSKQTAVLLLAVSLAAAVISLVCYLLYYNLDSVKGYIDGAVPLILVMAVMMIVTVSTAAS